MQAGDSMQAAASCRPVEAMGSIMMLNGLML
jgi:hypothetical protein